MQVLTMGGYFGEWFIPGALFVPLVLDSPAADFELLAESAVARSRLLVCLPACLPACMLAGWLA